VVVILLGAGAGLFALAALILFLAGRARARAIAEDVRARVEPFLRRKAAEAGIPADAPTWTARSTPEEIVGYSSRLAARLTDHAKLGFEPIASDSMSFGKTLPGSGDITPAADELAVPTAKTKKQGPTPT
jgi:hypothetical protein